MKVYEERAYATKIMNHTEPMIVRLDGHCFHTFTKGFQRPFDENLHRAMVLTTGDLVQRFHAQSGYTQSDEITLIWDAAVKEQSEENDGENERKTGKKEREKNRVHLFGGRATKIASVLSGYCSTRFNYHLTRMASDGVFADDAVYAARVQQRIVNGEAHFDGRAFNVPSAAEVLNNVIWRCHFDCTRNSISNLARSYYSARALNGKSSTDKLEMLRTEHGVDWECDVPMAFKYGTFVKRELYDKQFVRQTTQGQETGVSQRTRIGFTPIKLDKFEHRFIKMLLSKYWSKEWLEECESSMQTV